MPGFIGLPEIIMFLVVALLIFGPKKLPEMGRSLGKGMREFKDSVSGSDAKPKVVDGDEAPVARLDAADSQPNPFASVETTPTASSDATATAR